MLKKLLSVRPGELIPVDFSLLILRISAAAFMLTHGWPKILRVLNGNFSFGDPIGLGPELSLILAAFAEGICSMLIIAGLGTRLASIPLIITMSVAAFVAHADDPFGSKEKSLLFLVIFLFLFFTGPGKYSADSKLKTR